METLRQAWERVRENAGCRGSDGITVGQFARRLQQNLQELQFNLQSERYAPYPLMRFPVPKRNRPLPKGGTEYPGNPDAFRHLSVPTVRDRIAQTAVFLATREIFEAEFENVSHAYREGRGVKTAVYAIREWRDRGYRWAVDGDIDDFFDNIDHQLLFDKIARLIPDQQLLRLFRLWIPAEVYDDVRLWSLEKGIPQGSAISPPLANLFLDELDETLSGFGQKLVRYADDFLILCQSPEKAQEAIELTDMLLEDLKLKLNPLKTKIVSFDRGFRFLGAIFMAEGVYLPMKTRKESDYVPKLPPPLTLKHYIELRTMAKMPL
jgi:group II intron reverse transcriptase/maturase